jgi:hypothetical protein
MLSPAHSGKTALPRDPIHGPTAASAASILLDPPFIRRIHKAGRRACRSIRELRRRD